MSLSYYQVIEGKETLAPPSISGDLWSEFYSLCAFSQLLPIVFCLLYVHACLTIGFLQVYSKFMSWVDEQRTMKVYNASLNIYHPSGQPLIPLAVLQVFTNADTPKDAAEARRNGAEGIGLVRTEHMFFASDERLKAVRQMIMAENVEVGQQLIRRCLSCPLCYPCIFHQYRAAHE